ncbi:MAG: aminotransferase [marine bacterium B5-7]|nr:MAG: aminotransferase [marine bacterium B5-7]
MVTTVGNRILAASGTTVFVTNTRLAIEHGSVNLGQGFPDEGGPVSMMNFLADYTHQQSNQYPPMMGLPELCQAVARHAERFYDLKLDWSGEVMVTSGATEALASSLIGLLNPGDEAILIEPLYDAYLPLVRLTGATPVSIRLNPPDWSLDLDALKRAISPRTRVIVVNNPMNPTGKVFSRDELVAIAELAIANDIVVIADEVYEHLVFDDLEHIPMMTLPGMRERCVRIGSSGKIFSLTGWKVGFISAAPALLKTISRAHQFLVFTTPPNLQAAVAYGLDNEVEWYTSLAHRLQAQRDYLSDSLESLGFVVLPSRATYFLTVDIRAVSDDNDVSFCRTLTIDGGVTGVPVSAFYIGDAPDHLLRLCFCKDMSVLEDAVGRLRRWRTVAA